MTSVGEIIMFAGTYSPQGFMPCDGRALPIAQYSALFAVIGTTYGGDASTFRLPDMRRRIAVGAGQGPGLSARAVGQRGGVEDVVLSVDQLPAHTHQVMASVNNGTASTVAGNVLASTPDDFDPFIDTTKPVQPDKQVMADGVIGVSGGNAPHNNMMSTLFIGFHICVEDDEDSG